MSTVSTLSSLPTAPSRDDSESVFISRADAFLAALVTLQTEFNTSIGEFNSELPGIDAANALVNFQGAWSGATGAASIGDSYSHNSKTWRLEVALADITTSEPGVTGDWTDITPLVNGLSATLSAGYDNTLYDNGTQSSGTLTIDFTNGHMQEGVNGGAHTLTFPTTENYAVAYHLTNNASAGAITITGGSDGDALTTTNGDKFIIYGTCINGDRHVTIKALQ